MHFRFFVIGFTCALVVVFELASLHPLPILLGWMGVALLILAILWRRINKQTKEPLKASTVNALLDNRAGFFSLRFERGLKTLIAILLGAIIGICYVSWYAFFGLKIDETCFEAPCLIQAKITQPPVWLEPSLGDGKKLRMQLAIEAPLNESKWQQSLFQAPKIQLDWYLKAEQTPEDFGLAHWPQVAERFEMAVKLKRPRGQHNPAGFDYERYLFAKGIQAKGYLKTLPAGDNHQQSFLIRQISPKTAWQQWSKVSGQFLASVHAKTRALFEPSEFGGLYKALVLGDRSGLQSQDWTLWQSTGTVHLMAISGLHIGIIALVGYGLFWGLWKAAFYRVHLINLPIFAKFGALLFASVYAYLSGFSIATERAWLMVVIGALLLLSYRHFQRWSVYFLVLFCVLLWQPTAVLLQGFWLSFIVVALIFISIPFLIHRPWWQSFVLLQLFLSVATLPLLGYFYSAVPVYGFIANLVALPLISFLILPMVFLLSLLNLLLPTDWLIGFFHALDFLMFWLMQWLKWIQTWPYAYPHIALFSMQTVLLFYFGLFAFAIGLAYRQKMMALQSQTDFVKWMQSRRPRKLVRFSKREKSWLRYLQRLYRLEQARNLAESFKTNKKRWQQKFRLPLHIPLLTPLLLAVFGGIWLLFTSQTPTPLDAKQFDLMVLDVGQGQAVVVETKHHRLLYDAGPAWGENIDAAKLAILPFLFSKSISEVDVLLVSHSDNDHAGGLKTLRQNVSIQQALSGQPEKLNAHLPQEENAQKLDQSQMVKFSQCEAGQRWQWDGVDFEILAPLPNWLEQKKLSDNDTSCVLQISTGRSKVVISGDLGKVYEDQLIADLPANSANQTLLIAGHHGSKYSNSAPWLDHWQPDKIAISAGADNRFRLPNQETLQRLSERHIAWWNTACSGALQFRVSEAQIELINQSRVSQAKWYYQPCENFE